MVCNKCDPDGTYNKADIIMPEILPDGNNLIKERQPCEYCGETFPEPLEKDSTE